MDLLSIFLDQINLIAAGRTYSSFELATRALERGDIHSETFTQALTAKLNDDLRVRYSYYAKNLPAIADGRPVDVPTETAGVFCGLVSPRPSGELGILLSMYSKTCGADGAMLEEESYIRKVGGAFSLPNPNLASRVQLDQIYAGTLLSDVRQNEIKLQLAGLQRSQTDILDHVGRTRLDGNRRKAAQAIAAAEARRKAEPGQLQKMATLAIAVSTGGAALGAVYGALESMSADGVKSGNGVRLYSEKDRNEQAKNLKLAAKDAFTAYHDIKKARGDLNEKPQPNTLLADLRNADNELRSFSASIAEERDRIRMKELSFMSDIFISKNILVSNSRAAVSRFPDLLKMITIDFVADPSRDISRLENNVQALTMYIESFPNSSGFLNFRFVDGTCSIVRDLETGSFVRKTEDCIRLEPSVNSRTVFGVLKGTGRNALNVPMYTIASGPQQYVLPLFSVSRYSVVEDGMSSRWDWALLVPLALVAGVAFGSTYLIWSRARKRKL